MNCPEFKGNTPACIVKNALGYFWGTAAMLARVTGLEPATSGVTGRRSNQLSYTRIGRPQRLDALPCPVKRMRRLVFTFLRIAGLLHHRAAGNGR
jgi:hypothetical protein